MPDEVQNSGQDSQQGAESGLEGSQELSQHQSSETTSEAGEKAGFTFKGRTLSSNEEIQQALALAEKIESRNGRLANQLGELRQEVARHAGFIEATKQSTTKEDPEKEWDDLEREFFENPKQAFKKLVQRAESNAKELVAKEKEQIIQQRTSEAARQRVWDSFYEKHPHLATYRDDLVPHLVESMGDVLRNLPTDEALEKLAEAANRRHLEIVRKIGGSQNGQKVYTEAGSRAGQSKQEVGLPKDPLTYKDLHKNAIDAVNSVRNRIRPANSAVIK